MKLTEQRLKEITTREKAASPGPWEVDGRCISMEDDATRPGLAILLVAADDEVPLPDLAFAAHAREDVPHLVADLLRAREMLSALGHDPAWCEVLQGTANSCTCTRDD